MALSKTKKSATSVKRRDDTPAKPHLGSRPVAASKTAKRTTPRVKAVDPQTPRSPKKAVKAKPSKKRGFPDLVDIPDFSAGRYLRSFTVRNLRTFRSPVVLDFCRPDGSIAQWTVILGENGCGKTTLLQYLAGMMPVQDDETARYIAQAGSSEGIRFRPIHASQEWINWHMRNVPFPWPQPAEFSVEVKVTASSRSLAEVRPTAFDVPFGMGIKFGEANGQPTIQMSFSGTRLRSFYEEFRLFGYGASRHIAGPSSPYLASERFADQGPEGSINTLFNDDLPLVSPEQWLRGLDHARLLDGGEGNHAEKILENARRCLSGALPDIEDIWVGPFGFLSGQKAITLLCKTPFSPKPLPFAALSIGYRTMAAWLTDFLKRMHEAYPHMEHPDDAPAVILIDEFDLHMHPRWQRLAMDALSREFPNTQFIVTAHSPLVVQAAAGSAKIIVLRRQAHPDGGEEVVVDPNPQGAANWRIDQILESFYGVSPLPLQIETLSKRRVELRQKEQLTQLEQVELNTVEEQLEALEPPSEKDASEQLVADLKKALEAACGIEK